MKNNFNLVDLHIHSKYSDGTDGVDELLQEIDKKQITIFSVTDHDTLDFYDNIDQKSLEGMKLIPGIEFSCITEAGKCHILGYGIDVNNTLLRNTVLKSRTLRNRKFRNRILWLEEKHGIVFSDEEKTTLANIHSVGKPHLAQMLIEKDYAASIEEAIITYLSGMPEERDRIEAKEAIGAIKEAGGIPVWAHPLGGEGETRLNEKEFEILLNILLKNGIEGLECYYSRYDDGEIGLVLKYAHEKHLYISGGSDYHGKVKNIRLGELKKRLSLGSYYIGRELTILYGLGIDKYDDRFKKCTYNEMKQLCKTINIYYEGSLFEKIKAEEGYHYRKFFDSYTSVFDNSSLFKRRSYDEIENYTKETVYESEHGIINILVSDYDPLAYWDFSSDENDWDTVTAVSNYSDEFLRDIITAHEEYYGVKIYHQRYESDYGTRGVVISDEEIDDARLEQIGYIKV